MLSPHAREFLNGTPLWTPASQDLSAYLAADWDAEDHGTARMTDDGGGAISSWTDKIGSMAVTAADPARPTWVQSASAEFPYPALSFDGTDDCFASTSLGTLPTGATAGDVVIVGHAVSSGSVPWFIAYGSSNVCRAIRKTGGDRPQLYNGSTDNLTTADAESIASHPGIFWGSWSGTTQNGFCNGKPFTNNPGTTSTLNTGTTRFRIGANLAASAAAQGPMFISRVWIFKVVASSIVLAGRKTTLQEDFEGYSAWKWGFQKWLRGNHPWKWRAPR